MQFVIEITNYKALLNKNKGVSASLALYATCWHTLIYMLFCPSNKHISYTSFYKTNAKIIGKVAKLNEVLNSVALETNSGSVSN